MTHIRIGILGLSFFIVSLNVAVSLEKVHSYQKEHHSYSVFLPGIKFTPLKRTIKNSRYLGYYSDKNLKDKAKKFELAQAQYFLAPTILDLENVNHRFILLDCTTEETAFRKMQELQAIPLMQNDLGMILAQRKGDPEEK